MQSKIKTLSNELKYTFSVPDKRRVSGQKPEGNRYLTRHVRKGQLAKVLL